MPPMIAPVQTLTLTRPDDWHLHLRDGELLRDVLPHTAARFARAIVMPNLKPPITTVKLALEYHERILAALPRDADFTPLMTLYLTENTKPEEIRRAKARGVNVRFLILDGPPGEAIVDVARSEQVDMVVVGSHGRGVVGRFFVGSVSEYVVRHAPCPVLVVRA